MIQRRRFFGRSGNGFALQDRIQIFVLFFFFNDTATTEIYTLSLHDALPIPPATSISRLGAICRSRRTFSGLVEMKGWPPRSEEHTSELQSHVNLVCRLL